MDPIVPCISLLKELQKVENPSETVKREYMDQLKDKLMNGTYDKTYLVIEFFVAENKIETAIKYLESEKWRSDSELDEEDVGVGQRPGRKLLSYLGVTFMLIASLFVTYFGYIKVINAYESSNWPSVSGVVAESEIIEKTSSSSEGGRNTTEVSQIKYSYEVNHVQYSGSTVSYRKDNDDRKNVERYPVGKEVVVYYQPDNPEECVLETGVDFTSYFLLVSGIVSFLVVLVATIKYLIPMI